MKTRMKEENLNTGNGDPFAAPPNLLELIFRQPLSLFLYTSSYFDFILGLPHPRKPHPYRLLLTLPLLGLNV